MAGGGIAEVDSSITAYVNDSNGNGISKVAWRRTGTGFVTAGLGLGALFTKNIGIFLEPRFMQMFPTSGEVISGQLLGMYGF